MSESARQGHADPQSRMENDMTANTVNLSDLITLFYDEYLALYGDEELASVAAAATINDILADRTESGARKEVEAA